MELLILIILVAVASAVVVNSHIDERQTKADAGVEAERRRAGIDLEHEAIEAGAHEGVAPVLARRRLEERAQALHTRVEAEIGEMHRRLQCLIGVIVGGRRKTRVGERLLQRNAQIFCAFCPLAPKAVISFVRQIFTPIIETLWLLSINISRPERNFWMQTVIDYSFAILIGRTLYG